MPNVQSGYCDPAYLQCPSAIIVLTNAPLKGAMSHQPRAAPWGNKGNITDDALQGQKRFRWEENAFAPSGAESSHGIQYPRRCLGLYDCWPFRPPQHGRGLIVWFQRQRKQTKTVSKEDARGSRVPLGAANQRSLFAKRGKVNGWYEITP